MDTFNTNNEDNKEEKKQHSFYSKADSVKERLQQFIDEGMSKYEIAMQLPDMLKRKEGIEEKITRYYIRKHFEEDK